MFAQEAGVVGCDNSSQRYGGVIRGANTPCPSTVRRDHELCNTEAKCGCAFLHIYTIILHIYIYMYEYMYLRNMHL